jgi:hypothetical protein
MEHHRISQIITVVIAMLNTVICFEHGIEIRWLMWPMQARDGTNLASVLSIVFHPHACWDMRAPVTMVKYPFTLW